MEDASMLRQVFDKTKGKKTYTGVLIILIGLALNYLQTGTLDLVALGEVLGFAGIRSAMEK